MPRREDTRSCFIAEEGNKLITSDISQIELRIIADQTGEPSLVEAFANGVDVHTQTAADFFGKPIDKVTKAEREFMKPINYGVPYGMGAAGLAFRTGVSKAEAQATLRQYYATNKKIVERFAYLEKYFQQYNCVRSASGRLRVLNEWNKGTDEYFQAIQASKNFPIQATCADMIKLALTKLHREYTEPSIKMCGTVHDEVIIEAPEEIANDVAKRTNELMVEACQTYLRGGTPVEVGTGKPSHTWEK